MSNLDERTADVNENENDVQEESLLATSENKHGTAESPGKMQRIIGMIKFAWTYWKPPINYIIDLATDISATVKYWLSPDVLCGILGVVFITVPFLLSAIYKFKLDGIRTMTSTQTESTNHDFTTDNDSYNNTENDQPENSQGSQRPEKIPLCTRIRRSIVITWYLEILFQAIKLGNLRDENLYISKCALLTVIETFLESAPQINLQWFYDIRRNKEETWSAFMIAFTCVKIALLVSSIPSYCKAIRDIQKNDYNNLTITSTIMLILWNVLLIIPRVFLISLFAAKYPFEAIISIFAHATVMIMFLMIITRNTRQELCNTRCLMTFHCVVLGFVYVYTYVHITGENHKRNYIFYYVISIVENFVMAYFIGVFYMFIPAACIPGIFIMFLYFYCYHPLR